jgi:hypothetical protein
VELFFGGTGGGVRPARQQATNAKKKVGRPKPRPTPRAIRLPRDIPWSAAGSKLMTAAVVVYERSSVVGFPSLPVTTVEELIVRFTTGVRESISAGLRGWREVLLVGVSVEVCVTVCKTVEGPRLTVSTGPVACGMTAVAVHCCSS